MVFKNSKQRKAVMAKLKAKQSFSPSLRIQIKEINEKGLNDHTGHIVSNQRSEIVKDRRDLKSIGVKTTEIQQSKSPFLVRTLLPGGSGDIFSSNIIKKGKIINKDKLKTFRVTSHLKGTGPKTSGFIWGLSSFSTKVKAKNKKQAVKKFRKNHSISTVETVTIKK